MKQWANTILIVIVLIACAYGIQQIAAAPDVVSLLNPEVGVGREVRALKDSVVLENARLTINQVTKQVFAAFELSNKSKATVRDVSISCDFHDSHGEFWGRGRWKIYEQLAPASSARYVLTDRRFISHQAVAEQTECKIVDLEMSGSAVAKGH